MIRNSYLAVLAAVFSIFVFSTETKAQNDNQFWAALFSNGSVSKDGKILLWFDGHARFSEDASRLGVSIIRPGVGYKVNDRISVWAGYGRVVSRASGRADINEDRIWQQATYKVASGSWGSLSGRTRLEQRMLSTGTETGHRLRQFFRWMKPVGDRWTITAWNETFIALNDTDFGAKSGFDQNRFFIGARYKAYKNVSIEGGYLLNNLNRGSNDQDNSNLAIAIVAPF